MATTADPSHRRRTALIAEDLLWLLLDDESGDMLIDRISISGVLAGALLVELTLPTPATSVPLVRISGAGELVKPGRLVCADTGGFPTDPILVDAMAAIEAVPCTPKQVIQKLERGLHKPLLARLSADERVYRNRSRLAGGIPWTSWPTLDQRGKDVLRRPLQRALLDGQPPDPRTAALIALLRIVHALPQQCPGWRRSIIEECADRLVAGCNPLVSSPVDAVQAAVCDTYAGAYLIL
ncbi:GOLPH3/VPS74 family protein [Nocardia sp. NBC_00403]|uniref:GOLPH3/VPS74 family protein n=1 Tax=Nocardia sp. NBC_00403 TaxID=2975990 RepID=UPI002E1F26C9